MLAPAPQRQPPPRQAFGSSISRSSTHAPGHCGGEGPQPAAPLNPVSSMSFLKLHRNSSGLYFPRYFDYSNPNHASTRGCFRSNLPPSLPLRRRVWRPHCSGGSPASKGSATHRRSAGDGCGGGMVHFEGIIKTMRGPIHSMLENDARQKLQPM